jgi:hypothetical protein
MKTTISRYDFERAFVDAGRKENFSYEALGLLFDYFEEYEESTGSEIELDVISICCEYSEDNFSDIASNYSIDLEGLEGEERIEAIVDYLNDHTTVVGLVNDETIVYACF